MTPDDADGAARMAGPLLSVVIVGRDGMQSLGPILRCLSEQTIAIRMEVIVVLPKDRAPVDAMGPWSGAFQTVRTVMVPVIGNRGRAAAAGVREAAAPVIAFTENHCFPDPDWAERLCARHDGALAGAAPVVLNANPETALSWAIYGAGYAVFSDRDAPESVDEMPLHNTSYRSDLLLALDNELEDLLGHEGGLQRRLREAGGRFVLDPAAKTRHINEATWVLVLGLNLANGRRYGGSRGRRWPWPKRALYIALFPALSLNIARETVRRLRSSRPAPRLSTKLLAAIWLQSLAHAAGEAWGYLSGPRDEFKFVDAEEFMILERLGGHAVGDPRIAGFVAHAVPIEARE